MLAEPDSGTQYLIRLLVGHATMIWIAILILALVEGDESSSRVLSHGGDEALLQDHWAD